MARKTYEGEGWVCMNCLGPHYYVDVVEGEKPPGFVDLVSDRMYTLMAEVDADHGWNIGPEYIKDHERITRISWSPNPDASYGVDVQIESPSVCERWYSRRQLREYTDNGDMVYL